MKPGEVEDKIAVDPAVLLKFCGGFTVPHEIELQQTSFIKPTEHSNWTAEIVACPSCQKSRM